MSVQGFKQITPPERYDDIPYNRVRSEFSATEDGTFVAVETDTLSPLDTDPAHPMSRDITVNAAPAAEGWMRFVFIDADDEESAPGDPIAFPPSDTGPFYATASQLRDELDIDEAQLSNAQADRVLNDAEDLIDHLLGARSVDDTTGRKVVSADVESWQFTKLARATVKLAARLTRDPTLNERFYATISGPDFSRSGPLGSPWGEDVEALLNASGLRQLTTIVGGRSRPSWYGFAVNLDRD